MRKPLTHGFSSFFHRRWAKQHVERRPLLDSLASSSVPVPPSAAGGTRIASLGQDLLAAAWDEPALALTRLRSQADELEVAEAARRLVRDGPNEVQHEPPLPGWLWLWRCYVNPFNLLLTALALLSFLSADAKSTVVISIMVGLSTSIRFVQEGRSHRAAQGLRAMVSNTAAAFRRQAAGAGTASGAVTSLTTKPQVKLQEIALRELVAGDIVALSASDMVLADCHLLTARDLFVAQAVMTGESLPVEKFVQSATPQAAPAAGTGPLDQRCLVFMGTNVTSGTATALVVATGGRSYFGMLAAHASATETAPNAFQACVNSVSWLLIQLEAVMVPIVFFVNGFTKGVWLEAFLFAQSVAVGAKGPQRNNLIIWPLDWDAMLGAKRAVWLATQAIRNDAARPSPASQMIK